MTCYLQVTNISQIKVDFMSYSYILHMAYTLIYSCMKSGKQLSTIALLSLIVLSGCTNNNAPKKEVPVAPKDTNVSPSVEILAPVVITPSTTTGTTATGTEAVTSTQTTLVSETEDDTVVTRTAVHRKNIPSTVSYRPATKDNTVNPVVIPENTIRTGELYYTSPAGPELVKISITTKDGIIVETTATPTATNPKSLKFQQAFAGKVSASIVGKAVKGLKVDTISGASLTTKAFNDFFAN